MSDPSPHTDLPIGTPVIVVGVLGESLPGDETYWGHHSLALRSIGIIRGKGMDENRPQVGYRINGYDEDGNPSHQTLVSDEFVVLTPDRIEWFLSQQE